MKKIKICLLTIFIAFFSITTIYGYQGIIDIDYSTDAYKSSDSEIINLPFLRVSGERITMDKDIDKSGISFARNSIDVVKNLKGIQTLVSQDIVRINGNMEYGLIIAPTVVIDGKIDKSVVIMANNVTLNENSVIKEDLIVSCGKLISKGTIEGNLLGTAGDVELVGTISKDFRLVLSSLKLQDSSKIEGNVYIESYNDINIKDKYPNATIKVIEKVENNNFIDIFKTIKISLLFSLIYLLLSLKTNLIKNMLEKVKKHRVFTIASGILSILLIPLLIGLIFFIIFVGLEIIAIPVIFTYLAFMIATFMLSALIVGSTITEYIFNKYSDKLQGFWSKLIISFILFMMISLIPFIPYVGYTISLAICMISAGIVFTSIFKKIK